MSEEKKEFKNRVFGAVILKSINSNFNADFTHHPRTLPDGVVYSTDKALKYCIKDYFKKQLGDKNLFYIKRLNEGLNPLALDETYDSVFKKENKTLKDLDKKEILKDLLSCLDIRLFGATFAPKGKDIEKKNISIHGVVQINHGVNRFMNDKGDIINDIYTEDILSPFRNPSEKEEAEKGMSTIGNQTNLKEGHYVFHFSINPRNTSEFYEMINNGKSENEKKFLATDDIDKLKEAFNNSVTALDSSRKIGTENEVTVWIQLNENSKKMIPSLTELIDVKENKEIDFSKVDEIIKQIDADVEKVEVFYNPKTTKINGLVKNNKTKHYNILNNSEI